MRELIFKMERPGLLQEGQEIKVTEGTLPRAYYYTIVPSLAMSGNIPFTQRLHTTHGKVVRIEENDRGYYVVAEFDEAEV